MNIDEQKIGCDAFQSSVTSEIFPTEKNMSRFHPGVVAGVKFLPC